MEASPPAPPLKGRGVSSPKLGEVARRAGGVCNTAMVTDTRPCPAGTPSNLEGEMLTQ